MPNTPVPAAAIGLPGTSRRSALAGAAALVAAVSIPALAWPVNRLAAPGAPDPVFAAIDAWRAAEKAMNEGPEEDEDRQPLFDEYWAKLQALGSVIPTSHEGAALLVATLIDTEKHHVIDETSPLLPAMFNVINASLGTSFSGSDFFG